MSEFGHPPFLINALDNHAESSAAKSFGEIQHLSEVILEYLQAIQQQLAAIP